MKFARYLEDSQTPEWQRAYINYRLLKKRITAIRRAREAQNHGSPLSPASRVDVNAAMTSDTSAVHSVPAETSPPLVSSPPSTGNSPEPETTNFSTPDPLVPSSVTEQPRRREPLRRFTTPASMDSNSSRGRATSVSRMFSSSNSKPSSRRFTVGQKPHPYSELPLRDLLPLLAPVELAFFTTLDAELDKIEAFYISREHDMTLLTNLLEQQLNELAEHQKHHYASHPATPWSSAINTNAVLKLKAKLLREGQTEGPITQLAKRKGKFTSKDSGNLSVAETAASSNSNLSMQEPGGSVGVGSDFEPRPSGSEAQPHRTDFHDAKHKLRKAVMEHYRGLEMLQNYRILNLTGIRKALKKFQKVTKIAAQNVYISEKVDKMTFASGENVRVMMDRMEVLYAERFTRGDKKKALNRLRLGPAHKSHHVSTFWSGLFFGLAVPALAAGLHRTSQQTTRNAIPGWDGLLFVYGVFFIPVIFSFLLGLNILVWSRTRINYVFIFELDLRTRLDHREYFQIPSILFAALCYAFWLSFARIGAPAISPTTWPLVWLGFTAIVMLDPFPVMFRSSRYWLFKSVGKLLTSGSRPVEFTDFWMGDQFCSLVFTLSNLTLVGCLYDEGFNSNWRKCGTTSRLWPLSFVLAILPFLIRLVQSVKRYFDSGLYTHLINAGKYGSGIVAYFCYFLWRHQGGLGPKFVVWCIFQTFYSLYALAWDLLMDWSILRFHEHYPLLRKELVYSDRIYLYYFAILSNILIRFIWVLYLPTQGPDMMLRTFIGGICEMLRRLQWNFYRLENEQLGNQDQYRATREVPLPYSLDESRGDGDEDEDSESQPPKRFSQRALSLRRQRGAPEV